MLIFNSNFIPSSSKASSDIQITPAAIDILHFSKLLADLALNDAIDTPWRKVIPKIMKATEKVVTENIILNKKLADTVEALAVRQERKGGKRAILRGVPHISNKE